MPEAFEAIPECCARRLNFTGQVQDSVSIGLRTADFEPRLAPTSALAESKETQKRNSKANTCPIRNDVCSQDRARRSLHLLQGRDQAPLISLLQVHLLVIEGLLVRTHTKLRHCLESWNTVPCSVWLSNSRPGSGFGPSHGVYFLYSFLNRRLSTCHSKFSVLCWFS